MDVRKLNAPNSCFPRFNFALKNCSETKIRTDKLMKRTGRFNIKKTPYHSINTVSIYIYEAPDEEKIKIVDIVKRDADIVEESLCKWQDIIQDSKDPSNVAIFVLNSNLGIEEIVILKELDGKSKICVVNTAENLDDVRREFKFKSKEHVHFAFSTTETLAKDIDNILEDIAYKPLGSHYEELERLLHWHRKDETKQIQTSELIQEEDIVQLLEEITALYNMSNISIEERPKHEVLTEPLSKKMTQSLLEKCRFISAIGYRFRKVHVYLKKTYICNEENMKENEQILDESMKSHGISEYTKSYVFSEMKELMSVGSKLEARHIDSENRSGSLGCFAEMVEGNRKTDCILVSKHVVSERTDVFLVENGGEKKIGEVIESTAETKYGSLDIAAAKILVPVEADARKLKSCDGSLLDGKLDEKDNGENTHITGRRVHIWGSTSRPGKGIITDANYVMRGMRADLVEIKNEDADVRPFADHGDSGAIVCSDDPEDEHVNAHAMIMGANTETTHLAIPLKEGLEQLEEMTENKFALFEKDSKTGSE